LDWFLWILDQNDSQIIIRDAPFFFTFSSFFDPVPPGLSLKVPWFILSHFWLHLARFWHPFRFHLRRLPPLGAGGRRLPLQTLTPPLTLLPYAPLWRAAEGRLDAAAFVQIAMHFGYEKSRT
jgi:hypothetical protein